MTFKDKEKLFDFTVVIYSISTSYYMNIKEIFINGKLKTVILLILFSVYMTIYLSSVYFGVYRKNSNEKLKKIAYLILLQILFVTVFIMPIPFKDILENNSEKGIWNIVRLVIMGLNLIFVIFVFNLQKSKYLNNEEKAVNEEKKNTEVEDYLDTPIGTVTMILGAVLWPVTIYYYFTHFGKLPAFAASLGTVIMIPVIANLSGYLTASRGYNYYVEPILSGIIYSLWVDFIFYNYIFNVKSLFIKLFILLFSGVFSLRVFIFLEPPVKKIHIFTGVLSLLFFLFNLGVF